MCHVMSSSASCPFWWRGETLALKIIHRSVQQIIFAVFKLQFLSCTVTQLKNNSKTIQYIDSRNYHVIGDFKIPLQVLGLFVFPLFKDLSKYFAQIYRAQNGAAMLV